MESQGRRALAHRAQKQKRHGLRQSQTYWPEEREWGYRWTGRSTPDATADASVARLQGRLSRAHFPIAKTKYVASYLFRTGDLVIAVSTSDALYH